MIRSNYVSVVTRLVSTVGDVTDLPCKKRGGKSVLPMCQGNSCEPSFRTSPRPLLHNPSDLSNTIGIFPKLSSPKFPLFVMHTSVYRDRVVVSLYFCLCTGNLGYKTLLLLPTLEVSIFFFVYNTYNHHYVRRWTKCNFSGNPTPTGYLRN